MPPQPPGSQSESSSHPALSQSPMPQDRGLLGVWVFFIVGAKCSLHFKLRVNNVRFAGIYVPFPRENNGNPYCLECFLLWAKSNRISGFTKT